MRLAHDSEAPPTYGTWFCSCHGCATQLHALAANAPRTPIVLKFAAAPRERITAAAASRVLRRGRTLKEMCTLGPGDYLREVFVGAA